MFLKFVFLVLVSNLVNGENDQNGQYAQSGLMFCVPVYLQKNLELLLENANNSLLMNLSINNETSNQHTFDPANLPNLNENEVVFAEKLTARMNAFKDNLTKEAVDNESLNATFRGLITEAVLVNTESNLIQDEFNLGLRKEIIDFNRANEDVTVAATSLPALSKQTNIKNTNQNLRNADVSTRQNSLINQLINFVPSVLQNSPNPKINQTKQVETTTPKQFGDSKPNFKSSTSQPSTSKITTVSTTTTTTESSEKSVSNQIKTKEELEQQKIFDEFFGSRQGSYSDMLINSLKNRIGFGSKNLSKSQLKVKLNEELTKIKENPHYAEELINENKSNLKENDLNFIHAKLLELQQKQHHEKLDNQLAKQAIKFENEEQKKVEDKNYEDKHYEDKNNGGNSKFTDFKPKNDYVEEEYVPEKLSKSSSTALPSLHAILNNYRFLNQQSIPSIANTKKLKSYFRPPYQNEKSGYNYPIYGFYRN